MEPVNNQEELIRKYLKEYKNMSDSNITYFLREYAVLSEAEKSELIYEMVGKEIYETNPVGINTFVHDPYFLGEIYGGTLFKIWEDLLNEIYPAPFCKKYDQVVLSVATRCFGKGTKVRMFDGSVKNVEEIVKGDKVMGDDGTCRNVVSLAHGTEKLYKIIPQVNKEDYFVCNASHNLPLFKPSHMSFGLNNYLGINYIKPTIKEIVEGSGTGDFFCLKKVVNEDISLEMFDIEDMGEGEFFGFELDGNHLFRLASGYIQSNSGKSTCTAISLLYEIYLLTCMINPAKMLSGKATGNLVFAVLSKDNPTALSQVGTEIYKGLTQSPYFSGVVREKLSFSKAEKDGVQITDNILLKVGSSLGTVIGTDLYAGCMDEANAPSPRVALEKLVDTRLAIYKEMRDRHFSTFSKAPKMSGILWFTSSPTDEGDVLGEIIQEVQNEGVPHVLVRDNISRWEAREESTDDTFQFFLGSDTKDPCIVDETIELKPEEWERVIDVPNTQEYYTQFKVNPYFAIQNIAGRRTMPEAALFNTVSVFEKVFYKPQNIFTSDTPIITLENFKSLDDYMWEDKKDYFSHPDRPDCFRYIHLDMAYRGDRFGLASVYSDRIKYTSEDGHEIMRRKYFIDFCLGITTKNRETVDILKILEFIYSLKEKGYPLKLVTTDNHQGELARQTIAKRGVKTEYLSMEKSKEQYLNLKNIIITESLEGFINPALTKELRGLRESQKKIEKGKGYTDDMSDALAGALWSCSQDRFYKKNNEAISEIIKGTGSMLAKNNPTVPFASNRPQIRPEVGFTGIANRLRSQGKKPNRNGLGFNYKID